MCGIAVQGWEKYECCDDDCDASAAITNGVASPCPSVLPSGSSCAPTCNSGYTLAGSRSCYRYSLTDTAVCNGNPCKLTAPTNGALGTCASSLASGSSCTPSCNSGYTVYGSYSCTATALSGVSRSLPILLIRRDLPCPASPVLAQQRRAWTSAVIGMGADRGAGFRSTCAVGQARG